jgi:hypothetical protein
MSSSAVSKKHLVLEVFDRLFNKRDYGAIECWSDRYLAHRARA